MCVNFNLFLDLWNVSKSSMILIVGSLPSGQQNVGYWKEAQVISGFFKAKILKPQVN
jgi:hypothetical protein